MKQKQKLRDNFRNEVFKRDNYKCKICGRNDVKLDVHHIENRESITKGGYVKENGITLCGVGNGCHMKAERYHITNGKDWVDGFHPIDLYKLINSNLGLAKEKSEKL